jgi:hypothetical protein
MKEENNIDRLFQDAFAGFEVTPPDSVKAAIDQQIGSKRKGGYWLFGSLAVILLLTTISWWFWPNAAQSTKATSPVIANEQVEGSRTEASTQKDLSSAPSALKDQEHQSAKTTEPVNPSLDPERNIQPKNTETESGVASSSERSAPVNKKQKNKTYKTKPAKATKQTTTYPNDPIAAINNAQAGTTKVNTLGDNSTQGSQQSNGTTQKPSDRIPVKPLDSLDAPLAANNGSSTDPVKTNPADSSNGSVASNPAPNKTTMNPAPAASSNNKTPRWNIYALGGPAYSMRGSSSSVEVYNKWGYGIEVGGGRQLFSDKQIFAGVDFDYGKSGEQFGEKITVIDSVHVIDTIMITDPQFPDSVIGTQIIDTTYFNPVEQQVITNASIQRFGFGINGQFPLYTGTNWGVLSQVGLRYGQVRYTLDDSLASQYKLNSMQVRLGFFAYYDYRRFRFMAGLNSRYEYHLSATNAYFDKRSRILLAPQVGVAFKF